MSRRRVRIALAALATSLACGGCSFGPGLGAHAVSLRVTESFGSHTLGTFNVRPPAHRTDLQLLREHFKVLTDAAGDITSIGGHAQTSTMRWTYFINGVKAPKPPASEDVHKGDHVWFDLHDSRATDSVAAVVGQFPQPFLNGIGGQRYPSIIECGYAAQNDHSPAVKAACAAVTHELSGRYHIPLSPQGPGLGTGNDSLSINVAPWSQLEGQLAAELIKYGPGPSGVYAHFVDHGHAIALENGAGTVVRTLHGSTGMVAATNDSSSAVPTWLVTGTDPAAVLEAARAVTPQALANHFALVVHGGHDYPVPVS